MRTRIILTVVTAVLTAWPATAADNEPRTTDDVQDFVFLSDNRPLLVRLRITLDGKPFQAVWNDCIEHVFRSLDADKDGTLSRAEAERTPPAQVLFGGNFFGGGGGNPPTLDQLDGNRDGKVSRDELGNYYRRNGGAPFQLRSGSDLSRGRFITLGQGQSPSADALNEALFKLLDTDKDGKLSRDELVTTPNALLKLDASDDEMVTPQELLPGPGGGDLEFAVFVDSSGSMTPATSSVLVPVTPGESGTGLARQLQARYGPKVKGQPQAKKLTRKDLGLDEPAFKQLDADGDGELDTEELARFARRAPDAELTVKLGKANAKAAVDIGPPGPLGDSLRKKDGVVVFDLGTTRIDVRSGGGGDGMVFAEPFNTKDLFKMQFGMVDRDNNGYLDMNELKQGQGRFFANLFKLMDKDGDGMLYEKEMLAYLDQMQELQSKATSACVSLAVADQGRGLFDLLDTSKDGRLSVREMRGAVKLPATLDRDSDGQVGKNEVPRSYQLTLDKGPANNNPFGVRAVAFTNVTAFGPAPQPKPGPVWFHKMDRNNDGDVSRREFLGTDEQFARIDADGDGLISPDEAERADADLRKPKDPGQ